MTWLNGYYVLEGGSNYHPMDWSSYSTKDVFPDLLDAINEWFRRLSDDSYPMWSEGLDLNEDRIISLADEQEIYEEFKYDECLKLYEAEDLQEAHQMIKDLLEVEQ